jgi:hypothetical protein
MEVSVGSDQVLSALYDVGKAGHFWLVFRFGKDHLLFGAGRLMDWSFVVVDDNRVV